jgi:HD-like signal output (HDOD) protein
LSCSLTTAATADLLDPIVARADQLYSLPGVALEVVQLAGQPYLDTRALKACLENDPALTARVLKVVNSSIFGLPRKVTDLSQALGLLGIKPLKMLVLGFSLPKQLWDGVEAETVSWYWRHSLVKAVAARELAGSLAVSTNDADDAFLAALLQDIGILVLIQQLQSPYLKLLAEARGDSAVVSELEREALGFDHRELGGRLLEGWGLPPALVKSVCFPQQRVAIQKMQLPDRTVAQVLHLAHLLASVLDHPSGPALAEMLEAGEAYCRLSFEEVQRVVADVQGKVRDLAGILKLELAGGESYADLVTAAHAHLSDVAAAAGAVLAWRNREHALLVKTEDLRQELLQAAVASVSSMRASRATASLPSTSAAELPVKEPIPARPPGKSLTERLSLSGNPLLVQRAGDAVARCRAARSPLTLVLVGIDDFGARLGSTPQQGLERIMAAIVSGLTIWTDDRGPVWYLEQGRFALLWDVADRNEAVELIRHALKEACAWSANQTAGPTSGLTFSAGVGTLELPSKNFPPQELIEGAERCLSGALLSGGNTVKTIEL